MILDHGLTYTYEKNRIADEFVEIKFHIINEKEIEDQVPKLVPIFFLEGNGKARILHTKNHLFMSIGPC